MVARGPPGSGIGQRVGSLDADEFDLEDEGRVGRDLAARGRPVAVAEGGRMVSLRTSPTFMPGTPSSQPLTTWPTPIDVLKGWPRSRDESNLVPSWSVPT